MYVDSSGKERNHRMTNNYPLETPGAWGGGGYVIKKSWKCGRMAGLIGSKVGIHARAADSSGNGKTLTNKLLETQWGLNIMLKNPKCRKVVKRLNRSGTKFVTRIYAGIVIWNGHSSKSGPLTEGVFGGLWNQPFKSLGIGCSS